MPIDFRSEEEKQLEREARSGDVAPEMEMAVSKLLAIQSLLHKDAKPDAEAVRIGEQLYAKGGMDAMKKAAYRFDARGGNVPLLNAAWDGVGGWLA